ncbi:MAG: hypothetical protein WA906_06545 [Pacificimonas sp.]
MDMMSPDPRLQDLRSELLPGEQLVWSGAPDARRSALASWPIVAFGIPWTAFSLFWEAMAVGGFLSQDGAGFTWMAVVFGLFGLPFIAIGFGMLGAPLWVYRKAQATLYGITDRRVLSVTNTKTKSVESVAGKQIGPIKRTQRGDGTGTLVLETHSSWDSDGDRQTETFLLEAIADVRHVERLVRSLTG